MRQHVHLFISGKVQGVNFRNYTKNIASDLKFVGWVRNLSDGKVEVVAYGEKEKIQTLLKFLKIGTRFSKVKKIESHREEFGNFKIIY